MGWESSVRIFGPNIRGMEWLWRLRLVGKNGCKWYRNSHRPRSRGSVLKGSTQTRIIWGSMW